jgi:hypothetical protein
MLDRAVKDRMDVGHHCPFSAEDLDKNQESED